MSRTPQTTPGLNNPNDQARDRLMANLWPSDDQPAPTVAERNAAKIREMIGSSMGGEFAPDADLTPVTIARTDAIDAAGGLVIAANHWEKMARSRRYAGANSAGVREGFREMARQSRAAAARIQAVADAAL